MNEYAYFWIINLILIVDWAKNRRPLYWLWFLIVFGPISAFAYIIYYYEEINFPIELAKTVRRLLGKKVVKECPRCGIVSEIKAHQDGRQTHFMCQLCIERTFVSGDRTSLRVVQAAAEIVQKSAEKEKVSESPSSVKALVPVVDESAGEFLLWGVPSRPLELPKKVDKALKKVLELEKEFGGDRGASRSLHKIVAIQGEQTFSAPQGDQELAQLFQLACRLVGGEELEWMEWESDVTANDMRRWMSKIPQAEIESWLRTHTLDQFEEFDTDDSNQGKRLRESRNKSLDVVMDFLKPHFTTDGTLYWLNECDGENTAEEVYFLRTGKLGLFWVNYHPL